MKTATETEFKALRRARRASTAIWLESEASVSEGSGGLTASSVLAKAVKKGKMVTFVVYNLPNRDCSAGASAGEYCCSSRPDGSCDITDGSTRCQSGLGDYKARFIDRLASTVKGYCGRVPMAFVIEPDSLPNLVTNLGSPSCGNDGTRAAYLQGIKYAVTKISATCADASIYVDGGQGGWIGWENSSSAFMALIKEMNIASMIRGFAINVSNYHEIGILCPSPGHCNGGKNKDAKCCRVDPCNLAGEYNPGFTALNYAASLRSIAETQIPGFTPHFVIDTSRSGVGNSRKASCDNWCNVREAGLGPSPTSKTADTSLVDAYLWIKPPGESDGCTEFLPNGGRCARYSSACNSPDSVGSRPGEPRAPEAGEWFEYYLKRLATN